MVNPTGDMIVKKTNKRMNSGLVILLLIFNENVIKSFRYWKHIYELSLAVNDHSLLQMPLT